MLPPLPQMYRKNIIQATKCAHPLFFLLCRGEPTGTLMRDYSSDTCRPLQRALARTALKLVALSAYPRAYGTRTLSPYLRTLVHTVRTLPPLAAYLYTGFYTSYLSFLRTFLIIYLYLLYKSFKGFI